MSKYQLQYRSNDAYDSILLVNTYTGMAESRYDNAPPANVDLHGKDSKTVSRFASNSVGHGIDSTAAPDDPREEWGDADPEAWGELLCWRNEGDTCITMSESMADVGEALLDRMRMYKKFDRN